MGKIGKDLWPSLIFGLYLDPAEWIGAYEAIPETQSLAQ
jgi:hypothetical protein